MNHMKRYGIGTGKFRRLRKVNMLTTVDYPIARLVFVVYLFCARIAHA